ncbi:MAG: DUF4906 domain-containing protein [Bacteroidales bacterium]|nr:DUF4906 domain-containing protein [Bacteroidales bacterium]
MKRFLLFVVMFLCVGGLFFSCVNEDMEGQALLEGESTLSVDIAFRPLNDPLTTRTAGDAIKHINDLSIVIYKSDGTLHSCTRYTSSDFTTSEADYPNTLPQGTDGFAESKTCKTSTITIPNIPYGKYRMYAVVNMNRTLTEAETASEEALRAIPLTWNAKSIASNNAMFGFFDTEANKATVKTAAPDITINAQAVSLHAWVKRAASKVTVAYDGSNLYENVYIYIHSAQIKDIPAQCFLGKENTPGKDGYTLNNTLIANGETINYTNGTSGTTVGLTITKGNPKHGSDHSETADALFFFENMQGVTTADKGKYQDENGTGAVTHPNGSSSTDPDYKDGVPYGSYIEVKGYYVNKTATNASQGPITYRFMLGKDVVHDCNAERNNHYKLTLRFKNDANNPDWHIEYTPENPEISVPSPMYISYLHHEKLDIPVVVRGSTVQSFKAEIIDNDWYYDGHPKIHADNDYDYNGFLSFVEPDVNNTIAMTAAQRKTDYEKGDASTDSAVPAFKVVSPEGKQEYHYTVPVWTRSVQLGQGFSGNNAYVHKERNATVKFTAVVKDANGTTKTLTEEIEVIQVKRVVNPTGIWRPYNSTKQFHIVQMESDAVSTVQYATPDQVTSFRPTISDGPWAAEIIQGADWVRISKTNGNYGTTKLIGSTGSKIDFYYKPASTCASTTTRCGVIKITYHNNTCIHYIFVSQGLAPVAMGSSKTKWHMSNLHCQGVEEKSPLYEGSMFRFRNTYAAIIAENSYRPDIKTGYGYAPFKPIADKSYTTNTGGLWTKEEANGTVAGAREWPITNDGDDTSIGSLESEYTLCINHSVYNFKNPMSNAKIATCAQWMELVDLERYYGVMYGENSTETKTTADDAYEFPFVGVPASHTDRNSIPYNYDKGMRGMFVWDSKNLAGRAASIGNGHLFFPIGSTGHGHRMHFPDWNKTDNEDIQPYDKIGALKYATMSEELGDTKRPLLDDLYLSPGAIYWCGDWANNTDGVDNEPGYTHDGQNAQDINYHTYDFNTYSEYATWRRYGTSSTYAADYTQSSDACFIRCVEP